MLSLGQSLTGILGQLAFHLPSEFHSYDPFCSCGVSLNNVITFESNRVGPLGKPAVESGPSNRKPLEPQEALSAPKPDRRRRRRALL